MVQEIGELICVSYRTHVYLSAPSSWANTQTVRSIVWPEGRAGLFGPKDQASIRFSENSIKDIVGPPKPRNTLESRSVHDMVNLVEKKEFMLTINHQTALT